MQIDGCRPMPVDSNNCPVRPGYCADQHPYGYPLSFRGGAPDLTGVLADGGGVTCAERSLGGFVRAYQLDRGYRGA